MKAAEHIPAPVEYCRASREYPIYLHLFNRLNIEKEEIIPRHWHTNIEMTYRIKYSGSLIVDGQYHDLMDDSLFIINSMSIHEIHTFPQREISAILVSIPLEFLKSLIPQADFFHFVTGSNERNMKQTLLKMKEAKEKNGPNMHLLMYSLALELIYYMMEDAEPVSISSDKHPTEHNLHLQSEIITFLRENISCIKSTEEMSVSLGYSREYLSRFVSQNLGISLKSLIDQTRLDYSVHLIKNSKESLMETAEKAGFPSYRNFKTIFLKYYGFSPENYFNVNRTTDTDY